MIWIVVLILFLLWLAGFFGHIGGNAVHLLIVPIIVLVLVQMFSGRRIYFQ